MKLFEKKSLPGQVRSGQVRSGQVRSGQVRSVRSWTFIVSTDVIGIGFRIKIICKIKIKKCALGSCFAVRKVITVIVVMTIFYAGRCRGNSFDGNDILGRSEQTSFVIIVKASWKDERIPS